MPSFQAASTPCNFYRLDTAHRQAQIEPLVSAFSQAVSTLAQGDNCVNFDLDTRLLSQLLTQFLDQSETPDQKPLDLNLDCQLDSIGRKCVLKYHDFVYVVCQKLAGYSSSSQGMTNPFWNNFKIEQGCVVDSNGNEYLGRFELDVDKKIHFASGRFTNSKGHVEEGIFEPMPTGDRFLGQGIKITQNQIKNGVWIYDHETKLFDFYPVRSFSPDERQALSRTIEPVLASLKELLTKTHFFNTNEYGTLALRSFKRLCDSLCKVSSQAQYCSALAQLKNGFDACVHFLTTAPHNQNLETLKSTSKNEFKRLECISIK